METLSHPDLGQRTVGDIVSENYTYASVFRRYGIDFCCGGGRTLADACAKKEVNVDELVAELSRASQRSDTLPSDPRGWDAGFLVDYIINVHHRYVREHIPALLAFSKKVAKVHGDANPELLDVAELVEELAGDMSSHMADEEEILFPYVKRLASSTNGVSATPAESRETIAQMMDEHDHAGSTMRRIRELTSDYVPPEYACNTYRALFETLAEFESDLHRHVHLENNVLFPKVADLENGKPSAKA